MFSLIYTTIFLIGSTYYRFYIKDFSVYREVLNNNIVVSENINFTSLEVRDEDDISTLNGYSFDISNQGNSKQNIKISIIPNLLTDNVSNNYVKYMINNTSVHSLNMDGVIYIDNIDEMETKNINLKIWISDTYSGDLNYNGRVIVS